ncbi:polymerase [Drepanopeziza brunnea f. sp. 'multigermtubi' MB_m1]|uniref:Polymerase n=1 Tax=Marssonina brunnea f. sp. multigermtubi (strain MB_m1) TaxID=1072389 RepID=K1XIV8_MARBU|nr:polymerase [Drepanopeziza brunnea f. sp. 'multigermtubi' MB_m1]EKD12419.1 polymerase [Drepanopeziza brunnea f. sp. 'multigermtubi' MB_m1]
MTIPVTLIKNSLSPYDHKIELLEGREKALQYSLLYKISILKLKLTKAYLIDNLNKGFIEPLTALFAAPVLFAKKQDGSFRFCINFRALNNLIRKDRYPFPLIDKTFARLLRAKIFTKLDIRQAFHRIRIDPALKELITFKIRYGAYKCKVLLFGLTNGPATYQRYINDLFFDFLNIFYTAYLNDILIYSSDPLKHAHHRTQRLQTLLRADNVDPRFLTEELRQLTPSETAVTIEEIAELSPTFRVINQVLKANRTALSFTALRIQASRAKSSPVNHDFYSFNKNKHGYDNVFIIIDRFFKQAISIPCHKSIDAKGFAKLYIYHIYKYFKAPLTLTSDRRP